MQTDSYLDPDSLTEEDYGGGSELSVTGFLIFGLLTFWIYTVWNYHVELCRHLSRRLEYFRNLSPGLEPSPKDKEALANIIEKGFTAEMRVKYTCVALYTLSMLLVGVELTSQLLFGLNRITEEILYTISYIALGLGALAFCLSTVLFLSWVCKTIKEHEYCELLFAKYVNDHKEIKKVRPSTTFTRRWNKNQNWVAFFLILTVPITVSPIWAARSVQRVTESGANLSSINFAITISSILTLLCAAIFHFWGTQILVNMFNGHLRIEMGNQQILKGDSRWVSSRSAAVLEEDRSDRAKSSKQLVPERTLAAIMMTDMVGYSKEMEANEERAYSKLLEHNTIIRKYINENRGEEVKTIGDAFLVRFRSASDALEAALGIQKHLARINSDKEEAQQIWVRIGIHIGDVMLMEDDVFGNGVNVASRIEPLAEPGGICISGDVYNVVRKSIEIKVLSLGKRKLKNIADVPEIFKVLID